MSEPTLVKPVIAEASAGPSAVSTPAAPFSYAQAARASAVPSSTTASASTQGAKSSGTATPSSITKIASTYEFISISDHTATTPDASNSIAGSVKSVTQDDASNSVAGSIKLATQDDARSNKAGSEMDFAEVDDSSSFSKSLGVLQEAPIPSVNIWEQRAKEMKSKVPSSTDKASDKDAETTRSRAGSDTTNQVGRTRDDSKVSRKEHKSDSEKAKPHPKKAQKQQGGSSSAPSVQDRSLWPTLDLATLNDEKKKPQEKAAKVESKPQGQGKKNAWVHMPINPNVLWKSMPENPLRRGGGARTARGGKDGLSRGNSFQGGSASAGEDTPQNPLEHGRKSRSNTTNQSFALNQKSDTSKPARGSSDASKPGSRDANRSSTQSHKSHTEDDAASRDSNVANGHGAQARNQAPPKPRQNRRFDGQQSVTTQASNPSRIGEQQPAIISSEQTPSEAIVPTEKAPVRRPIDGTETNLGSRAGFTERRGYVPRDGRGGGGGRGRGGRAGATPFNPSHVSGSHFSHGSGHTALNTGAFHSNQRSPNSGFAPDAQAYFPTGQGPRNYRGHNGRTNSVAGGESFPRMNNGFGNGPAIGSIQTNFSNGMYDLQNGPMSAVMYNPYVDPYNIFGSVTAQLEYYLSTENLCKDLYLRKHMDSKGFVPLRFLADFNRMKNITQDMEMIKLASFDSQMIEYRVGPNMEDLVRPVQGWHRWVLSIDAREPAAQHDGPDESVLVYPNRPSVQAPDYNAFSGTRYPAQYGGMVAPPLRSAPLNGGMMNTAPMESQSAIEFGPPSGVPFVDVFASVPVAPSYSPVPNPNSGLEKAAAVADFTPTFAAIASKDEPTMAITEAAQEASVTPQV